MICCPLKFVLLFISEFCGKNQDINKAGNASKEIPLLKCLSDTNEFQSIKTYCLITCLCNVWTKSEATNGLVT